MAVCFFLALLPVQFGTAAATQIDAALLETESSSEEIEDSSDETEHSAGALVTQSTTAPIATLSVATAAEVKPRYADFYRQNLSASVVNGSTLRIYMDVDVEDDSGGDKGRCLYQLGPDSTINTYTGQLKYPWVEMQAQVKALRGEIVTESFQSVQTSSSEGRRLTFKGYWDISGSDLQQLQQKVQGNTLYWAAGFYKKGDAYSLSQGTVECQNLADALRQAACTHQNRRFEQIAGDPSVHNVFCADCNLLLGSEAHEGGSGLCSLCGYRFYVSGTCVYVLNGREEREAYQELPGIQMNPKAFPGYRAPDSLSVPENGGELRFIYEPIQYSIEIENGDQYTLRYDDSLFLPCSEKKGYRQEYYVVLL